MSAPPPQNVFSPESASAPHRRPPSSAVSALVLSLTAPLLCADLRVSAPPRQNHTLALSHPLPPRATPWHSTLRLSLRLCVSGLNAFLALYSTQAPKRARASS